jgi:hypothetical protein
MSPLNIPPHPPQFVTLIGGVFGEHYSNNKHLPTENLVSSWSAANVFIGDPKESKIIKIYMFCHERYK